MAKSKTWLPSLDAMQKRLWHFEDAPFQERYPAIYEFLATASINGEERKGGSMHLFAANGVLKVCFTDRHTGLCFYVPVAASEDFLGAMEAVLTGDHEPWQPAKKAAGPTPF